MQYKYYLAVHCHHVRRVFPGVHEGNAIISKADCLGAMKCFWRATIGEIAGSSSFELTELVMDLVSWNQLFIGKKKDFIAWVGPISSILTVLTLQFSELENLSHSIILLILKLAFCPEKPTWFLPASWLSEAAGCSSNCIIRPTSMVPLSVHITRAAWETFTGK